MSNARYSDKRVFSASEPEGHNAFALTVWTNERYTVAEVCAALWASDGLMTEAARRLGCHRKTLWEYSTKHPEVKATIKECRERLCDVAESRLHLAIAAGEPWAVCFYLKCQAKDRGYVQYIQLNPDDHPALTFQFVAAVPPAVPAPEGAAGKIIEAEATRVETEPAAPAAEAAP